MKTKIVLTGSILAFVVLLAIGCSGDNDWHHHGGYNHHMGRGGHMGYMMNNNYNHHRTMIPKIDLTKEQKKELESLDATYEKKYKPVWDKVEALHKEYDELKVKNEDDYNAFLDLRDKNHEAMTELHGIQKAYSKDFLKLLTDKQKKTYFRQINNRGNRHFMGNMCGPHHAGDAGRCW